MNRNWEKIYQLERTPWNTEMPERATIAYVEKIVKPCKMLDVGCGTGNESMFLAKNGFDVTGIDISRLAIEKARKKAKKIGVKTKFLVRDVTKPNFRYFCIR